MNLTDAQRYTFETTGLLIYRDFYPQAVVDRMRGAVPHKERGHYFHNDPEIFMSFMSEPWIIECCSAFIGNWFRFDHELFVCQNQKSDPYLHGGQYGSQGTCFHHSVAKQSWNGQLTVGMCLTEQNQETGGFSYIPGSHHAIHGGQWGLQHSFWNNLMDDSEVVRTPELRPGDLYVFSEALAHGQRTWTKADERITLYMKYVPGYMAWQDYEITKGLLKYATEDVHDALLKRPFVREGDYTSKDFRKSVRSQVHSHHEFGGCT